MGEENTTQTILVVGGGITGITAAIEAAEAGLLMQSDGEHRTSRALTTPSL